MRAYRGRDLAAVLTRRRLALTALLGVCLALGGCSSFAGFVSDTWPTWAGGMPKDVPPRPGAPGYEEFISHQQRQDPAAAGAAAPGAAAQAGAPAPGAPGTTATRRRRQLRRQPRQPCGFTSARAPDTRHARRRPTRGADDRATTQEAGCTSYATPARKRSWKCTMPTGRSFSTTISAVIFDALSCASASLANCRAARFSATPSSPRRPAPATSRRACAGADRRR